MREVLAKLSWNHNQTLLDKVKDKEIRKWYAKESIKNGWSVSILKHQILLKLYERQALPENKIENYSKTLPIDISNKAREILKDPYIFDFITANKDLKELDIEQELTTNITKFLFKRS